MMRPKQVRSKVNSFHRIVEIGVPVLEEFLAVRQRPCGNAGWSVLNERKPGALGIDVDAAAWVWQLDARQALGRLPVPVIEKMFGDARPFGNEGRIGHAIADALALVGKGNVMDLIMVGV